MNPFTPPLPCLALALLTACATGPSRLDSAGPITRARLAGGTYRLAYAIGLAPEAEQRLSALSARLDREERRLALAFPDGSRTTLDFAPRPETQWKGDCYTMAGHVECEVADLLPGPLTLASVHFKAPLIYAKCSPGRMILSDGLAGAPALVFDRQ